MPKRLAIAISGAVSLGSYEAGVLFEVIRAIGYHNQHADSKDAIKIDVITGASAGAMTAAIAAKALLYEPDKLIDPSDNYFYNPWVDGISIEHLIDFEGDDSANRSLLSSKIIDELADKYMSVPEVKLDADRKEVIPTPHPASAEKVWVGIAMANLNGYDYFDVSIQGNKFAYTKYEDSLMRFLSKGDFPEQTMKELRDAALSSGAFPIAFAPRGVKRKIQDYATDPKKIPQKFLNPNNWDKKDIEIRKLVANEIIPEMPNVFPMMTYTDGGTFNNYPLGMAKNLVDKLDNHRDVDNRLYLYVAPRAKVSANSNVGPEEDHPSNLNFGDATLKKTVLALINGVLNQAQYQEWVETNKINARIKKLNDFAVSLGDKMIKNKSLIDELKPGIDSIFKLLAKNVGGTEVNKSLRRLREQYSTPSDKPYFRLLSNGAKERTISSQLSQNGGDVWLRALLIWEYSSGIEDKDEMYVYTITADDNELLGDQFHAFTGFLYRKFRDHDYDVGRLKAIEWLEQMQKTEMPQLILDNTVVAPAPDLSKGSQSNYVLQRNDSEFRKVLKHVHKTLIKRIKLLMRGEKNKGFFSRSWQMIRGVISGLLVHVVTSGWLKRKLGLKKPKD